MHEPIRLKYFSAGTLNIRWASDRKDYVQGDCYVLAVRASVPVAAHGGPGVAWSEPMPLADARAFIAAHPQMLGSQIHDCVGVALEDGDRATIAFATPIRVRDRASSARA